MDEMTFPRLVEETLDRCPTVPLQDIVGASIAAFFTLKELPAPFRGHGLAKKRIAREHGSPPDSPATLADEPVRHLEEAVRASGYIVFAGGFARTEGGAFVPDHEAFREWRQARFGPAVAAWSRRSLRGPSPLLLRSSSVDAAWVVALGIMWPHRTAVGSEEENWRQIGRAIDASPWKGWPDCVKGKASAKERRLDREAQRLDVAATVKSVLQEDLDRPLYSRGATTPSQRVLYTVTDDGRMVFDHLRLADLLAEENRPESARQRTTRRATRGASRAGALVPEMGAKDPPLSRVDSESAISENQRIEQPAGFAAETDGLEESREIRLARAFREEVMASRDARQLAAMEYLTEGRTGGGKRTRLEVAEKYGISENSLRKAECRILIGLKKKIGM